jgi:hypothetical protein
MRGEQTRDREALMGAYGISRRLATRVVALLSKQLSVTPTLLSEAADSEPLEAMLLLPDLLRNAAGVTEDWLREQAASCGFRESELLCLVPGTESGWRTIALEDDVLADGSMAEEAESGRQEGLGLVHVTSRQISLRETEELFQPEEVARLKLTALTSQKPDERVESLRKLVFAPMDGTQKAEIFLNVLVDREAEPRVRREAVRSLEQIGFRSDMAEAVRGLFQEDTEETIYSIQRLGGLLDGAEQGESALVLAVVLEVFDQTRTPDILRELLQLISRSAGILVGSYPKTEHFVQAALRHLDRDFEDLRAEVEDAVNACVACAPELIADLLWREIQRVENPRVRSLLLNMAQSLAMAGGRADDLAARAVAEILNPDLPESEKVRLRYGLVRVGEPAIRVALDRIGESSDIERSELIRLIDVLCTESEIEDATVQEAVAALIDLLKLADPTTRRSVIQTALLGDWRVERQLQEQLARELLALMAELNLPGTLDRIQNTLERIGGPALEPAYEFMRRSYPSQPGARAAAAIARIVQEEPQAADSGLARGIYDLCVGLLGDERIEDGAFTIGLAAVCGHTPAGGEHFDEVLGRLRNELWSLPYSMDVLDALGVMAGSPNADTRHQQLLFELFDGIVSFRGAGSLGTRKDTEDGPVYEFGREIDFDTRVVPAAVKGLERICVSRQATHEMRRDIVRRFLLLWEGVSKVRIIWGPKAIEALIKAMCSAACSPESDTTMKVRLGASLLRYLNKITVVRSIGEIYSQPDDSPQMQRWTADAAEQVIDEWGAADAQDDERRFELLKSAGRIAANPSLDPSAASVVRMRDRALHALFSGLRDGMTALREPLLLMRECPGIAAAQKQEIDERLGKAFGLVRVGRSR